MKIRRDSAFLSSVLFTVALLSAVPWCWNNAAGNNFYGYLRPVQNGAFSADGAGVQGVGADGEPAWNGFAYGDRDRVDRHMDGIRQESSMDMVCHVHIGLGLGLSHFGDAIVAV